MKVLLADDSPLVRGLLRKIIESDPELSIVSSCGDGETALSDYKNFNPDIVILDVEMPHMDGLTCLQKIIDFDPAAKVIMCSSLTRSGAQTTFKALEIGALECLEKPNSGSIDKGINFEEKLKSMIKSLSKANITSLKSKAGNLNSNLEVTVNQNQVRTPIIKKAHDYPDKFHPRFPSVLAIGASTGGSQALPELFKDLNRDILLPIFVTQHIPAGFEECLAEAITKKSGFDVHVAEDNLLIQPGHIYLAKAKYHMGIVKNNGMRIKLEDTPPVNFCKPSINVMLDNIREAYSNHILAVLLTGMGEDGRDACARMSGDGRENVIIAQDQETSVVWGIPGAIAKANLCHDVLPLNKIAPALNNLINRKIPDLRE